MRYAPFIVIAALWAAPAVAQTDENKLRGMRQFELHVAPLDKDEDAQKCKISDRDLRQSVTTAATALGVFRIVDTADAFLYVNPTVLFVNDSQCMYNLDMQAFTLETVRLSQSRRTVEAVVELWAASTIGQSPIPDFAQYARDAMKNLAQEFIRDWNQDNR